MIVLPLLQERRSFRQQYPLNYRDHEKLQVRGCARDCLSLKCLCLHCFSVDFKTSHSRHNTGKMAH